jgi:hypothetical protein
VVGQGRRTIPAPATPPLPFGLLSAAVVVEDPDAKLSAGIDYEALACSRAYLTTDDCFTGTDAADLTYSDGVPYTTGDAFMVYALHRCRLVGSGVDEADRIVRAKFAAGEGRAVEEGFAAAYLTKAPVNAAEYPDLTPVAGTALPLLDAVATVEEWAADKYAGPPTLHVSRSTGTMLTNKAGVGVSAANGRLQTVQGSIVSSGAGYLAASRATIGARAPAAATERWLFVTGAVMVRRGPLGVMDPVPLKTAGSFNNEFGVLGMRAVTTSAECFRARILVQSPRPAAGL